ncbi:hypothetical protein Dda_5585 [Drechslerella dactyloides]|uniref:Uncharacterized protein n=1 Tax=Drechslerella dactyloides TaxID=74499 RepID=A0AAD6IWT0_DREDA|nr:hypothetical protein Dda_5585 [Drechslerella dactyloides]
MSRAFLKLAGKQVSWVVGTHASNFRNLEAVKAWVNLLQAGNMDNVKTALGHGQIFDDVNYPFDIENWWMAQMQDVSSLDATELALPGFKAIFQSANKSIGIDFQQAGEYMEKAGVEDRVDQLEK